MTGSCDACQYFRQDGIFEPSKLLAELSPIVKDPGRDNWVYWGDVFSAMVRGNLCQPSKVLITWERSLRDRRLRPIDFIGEIMVIIVGSAGKAPRRCWTYPPRWTN